MSDQIDPQDDFLSISQHVRKNIKTGKEELEISLFDVQATDDDGAVVTITAKDYEINRRGAQSHEIEKAARKIKRAFRGSWLDELEKSD